MTTQPHHLILKGTGDEVDILSTEDAAKALVTGDSNIILPLPMAAPAYKNHQTQFVADIIEIM